MENSTSNTLIAEVFLPSMRNMISEAAQKSENGEEIVNGLLNAFAMTLTDLTQSKKNAAALLSGLAEHLRNE